MLSLFQKLDWSNGLLCFSVSGTPIRGARRSAFFQDLVNALRKPSDWSDLGGLLNLPISEIHKIQSEPTGNRDRDDRERCFQCLQRWAEGLRAPYVEHILSVLKELDESWAIEVLKRAYPGVQAIDPPQWGLRSVTKVRAKHFDCWCT